MVPMWKSPTSTMVSDGDASSRLKGLLSSLAGPPDLPHMPPTLPGNRVDHPSAGNRWSHLELSPISAISDRCLAGSFCVFFGFLGCYWAIWKDDKRYGPKDVKLFSGASDPKTRYRNESRRTFADCGASRRSERPWLLEPCIRQCRPKPRLELVLGVSSHFKPLLIENVNNMSTTWCQLLMWCCWCCWMVMDQARRTCFLLEIP